VDGLLSIFFVPEKLENVSDKFGLKIGAPPSVPDFVKLPIIPPLLSLVSDPNFNLAHRSLFSRTMFEKSISLKLGGKLRRLDIFEELRSLEEDAIHGWDEGLRRASCEEGFGKLSL